MSFYVAAYDIGKNARRRRVATLLAGYGARIQRSVFEIWLEPEDVDELRRNLGAVLSRDDEFTLYPIDGDRNRPFYRWQRPINDGDPVRVY